MTIKPICERCKKIVKELFETKYGIHCINCTSKPLKRRPRGHIVKELSGIALANKWRGRNI